MARNARSAEQVTVAELLVQSAATRRRYPMEDTVILPRARHREKAPALRALARTRVFSVVAGALALAGGVAAAASSVSAPIQRAGELVWPPLDAGLPMVAVTPSYPGGTGGAGKTTPSPNSGVGVDNSSENPATPAGSASDSGAKPGHHGKPVKLAKAVEKVKNVGKAVGKATAPGQVAKQVVKPVRHDIPEVPVWVSARPAQQVSWAIDLAASAQRDSRQHYGGGGRHRR